MEQGQIDKALLQLYPNIQIGAEVILANEQDARGDFIQEWNRPEPQPTQAELDQAWIDWQAGADSRLWVEIRAERNEKLWASDWTQLSDVPIAGWKKTEWTDYRQSLRDIPQDFPNPGDVIWPVEPVS